ncbi:uncharacterized protein LOC110875224 [Helianthus annuus]|uniref:uncharacterized protein LOC110875224 n=1 Tax=Helianthus annuus TaxID=4232 RepID=UPI000B906533|nr:uncharacterized protein LOC110875224 [Helianthus annuus]
MTKEDYDEVDREVMELMDIRWCMASVIRKAQRFMEITRRKCLEGPDMMIGFDKAKVSCFKCKQKGHFKRECTNNKADDNGNPFHEEYYKKAIYHRNNKQPSRTQIEEGSSKEKKQAMLTINDECSGPNERKEKWWLVAEIKQSREERHACLRLEEVYDAFKEARRENRWCEEKECFVDPQGNPIVDLDEVNLEALIAAVPTVRVWCKGLKEIPRYREKVEEGIRKVIYASLEKKKEDC